MIKTVRLIHNPTAGDEEHNKEHLLAQIKACGLECRYSSTKNDDWKDTLDDADMIAVAGGDGTVRKVVKQLVKKKIDKPVGVLPLGTANNIAKTFQIDGNIRAAAENWRNGHIKKIDIGVIKNVDDAEFFLEGFGFGLFPCLMKEMKDKEDAYDSPEAELKGALREMHRVLLSYEPRECHLEIDGTDHSGKFYMVEVMNIKSIGPNIELSPWADPGDGEFEVVLVPEAHKEKFADYLLHKMEGGDDPYQFHTLKAKNIVLKWDGSRCHADDKLLKIEKEAEVRIALKEGALSFLLPEHEPASR
ncbi:MAG TPA: diacylglycerol kinase family protein [Flavisolibacter sp.]|nr:diacylglycerol kinase family protein [Flavisolibacter sp.]